MARVAGRGIKDVDQAIRACYAPSATWSEARETVMARLNRVVTIDAAFVATADPQTLHFSSGWASEPLQSSAAAFLDNEYAERRDVNRFVDLARADRPARTLDQATRGHREVSPRWKTIMSPIGLGDELRVALRAGDTTWGFLCLHREGPSSFAPAEVDAVLRVAPHVATAARRLIAASEADQREALLLCENDTIVALSERAQELLEDIDSTLAADSPLPVVLGAVLRRLEAIERHPGGDKRPAAATITTRSGSLLHVHATRLLDSSGAGAVALTLTRPTGTSLAVLRLNAHGLTAAQVNVAKMVLRGDSTREIAGSLRITQNTVQDHLKAAFDRLGVRSRRELVATLMH